MRTCLAFLFLYCLACPLWAQDSLREAHLARTTAYLRQNHLKQLLDSTHLQELKLELETLSPQDSLQKQKILAQIQKRTLAIQNRNKNRSQALDSLKKRFQGFEVNPFGETLFYIYTHLGKYSAEERAKRLKNSLLQLAQRSQFQTDSLYWLHHEPSVTLVYEGKILMSLTENDVLWYHESREALQKIFLEKILTSVKAHRQRHSWRRDLSEVSMGFLLLTGLIANVIFINAIFGWFHKRVFANRRRYKGFNLGNYQMFDRRRQVIFILFLLRFARLLLIFTSVYWIATYSFSIFPATEGFARTVWHYTLSPVQQSLKAVIDYIPNMFYVVIILILLHYFLKFVEFFAHEIERNRLVIKGFYAEWARPTFNLFKSLCYVFGFILVFPYLPGSSSPVFQTVSAFLGLLLSLGSSSAVSNMVAGIVITYMRAFKIGDRIKIGDTIGDVLEKNMLITRIKTLKDEVVTIPNANLLASNTLNFSASNPFLVHTSVTIGYDAPWRVVHELLIKAAARTEYVMAEPKPFVLQTALNDFYVAYEINAYVYKAKKMLQIYTELHQHIQDEFNQAGVEIMSPHYTSLRDGSASTVVPPEAQARAGKE